MQDAAVEIDDQADAAYVRLSGQPVVRTAELASGIMVDFDSQERVIGVEILGLRRRVGAGDARSFVQGLVEGLQVRALHPAAE